MNSITCMVKRLLSDGGMTETELAGLAGLSQPTVNRIKGGAGTSYETGKRIEAIYAARFGVSTPSTELGSRLSA